MRQLLLCSAATAFAGLLLGSATAHAGAPLIDFESFTAGDSAEGLGTIHPDLDIDALVGTATIIETGDDSPAVYGAPNNTTGSSQRNNCLEDANGNRIDVNDPNGTAKGFADPDAQAAGVAQEFDFAFAPGVTVNKFSLKIFDYGDFNPTHVTLQEVVLEGFGSSGSGSDKITFTTTTATNPRGPDQDFLSTGDACDADSDTKGEPGYVKLEVEEPGITMVTLRVTEGVDPNLGFDSISFTRDDIEIDIKPGSDPNCFNVNGNGVIPVAILGSDALNVNDIDISTLSFAGLDVRVKGNDAPQCSVKDVNGDTFDDLVCQFEDDASLWSAGDAEATLTGELVDGTPFEATDSICIRPAS